MARGSKTRINQAVEDLKAYYGILSQDDLFSVLLGSTKVSDVQKANFDIVEGKPPPEAGVSSIIGMLQSSETAYFAHEIMKKVNEYKTNSKTGEDEIADAIHIVYESASDVVGDKIGSTTSIQNLVIPFAINLKDTAPIRPNLDPKNPSKEKPALSAFVVKNNTLNPSKRGTAEAEIFLNCIPTIEMSRCVPFLDVTLIPSVPALSEDGRVQTISLLQFLKGNFKPAAGSADETIAKGIDLRVRKNILNTPPPKVDDEEKKKEDPSTTSAGMEIFTSPQTLVMGDESYTNHAPQNRGAPVIDRFRPFMSLKDFKVNLVPSAGLLTYKTAEMSLVLHDRSRLSEISEFVKPDLYGKTQMLITYGWSHPDGYLLNNVYGRFLDSLKCTEKYGVVNSSFSFDTVGQVNISLKLSLKGSGQVQLSKITEGAAVKDALKEVERLTEAIKAARKLKPGGKKGSKKIEGSQILSRMSDTTSAMGFTKKTSKELDKFIASANKAGNPGNLKKILPLLKELKTVIPKAQESMAAIVGSKVSDVPAKRMQSAGLNPKGEIQKDILDPFRKEFIGHQKQFVHVKADEKVANSGGAVGLAEFSQYTTFGNLLLAFCGYPLCGTGQFDEVQFVFYTFNSHASYMKDAPISSFPIGIQTFTEKFAEKCKTTTNMPIGAFIRFLAKEFVSSQTAEAYGLTDLYEKDKENPGKLKLKKIYQDKDHGKTLLKDAKDIRLQDAYDLGPDADLNFRVPKIQMQAECLTGDTDGKSIYRIHVFDQNSTSYTTLNQIWQASQQDMITPFTSGVGKAARKEKDKSGSKQAFVTAINYALESGILEAIPATTKIEESDVESGKVRFRVKKDFTYVKDFLKSIMPTIIYGTSTTNVLEASLGSMNNPAMTSINMRRSGLGSGTSALGLRESGLPLQIAPTRLSMTTMGMPTAAIGQTFFVDFGTGTSADNIYCASKVSHSITSGEFKTSWEFQPLNAYGAYTNIGNSVNQAIAEIESD